MKKKNQINKNLNNHLKYILEFKDHFIQIEMQLCKTPLAGHIFVYISNWFSKGLPTCEKEKVPN